MEDRRAADRESKWGDEKKRMNEGGILETGWKGVGMIFFIWIMQ